jgi:hypothetical protein
MILMDPAAELPENAISWDEALAKGKAMEDEEGKKTFFEKL